MLHKTNELSVEKISKASTRYRWKECPEPVQELIDNKATTNIKGRTAGAVSECKKSTAEGYQILGS